MSLARPSLPSAIARGAALAGALAFFAAHSVRGLVPPAGVQPIPDQPRADTAFVLEINSGCDGGLVRIEEAAVSVTEGVIRVDTVRRCGALAAFGFYSYPVVVPPVPAGEYRVEVWAQYPGDPDPRDKPELTGPVTVTEVGPLAGVRCIPGVEPAATLLFPYFEVDPGSAKGVTTLLAITNTWTRPVLANVVLWSNWALPIASFEIYLGGSDVQTLNLRDVLAGSVPVTGPGSALFPGCQPSDVAEGGPDAVSLLSALRGEVTGGECWATPAPGGRATGFVTVDVVRDCSDLLPGDDGYFEAGGAGVVGHDNALVGDFFLVEPGEGFAQGERAVHLLADPSLFGPGDETFYRDLAGSDGTDARMPLGRVQQARFLENPGFDGGTELLVWRDVREPPAGPIACDAPIWRLVTPWLYASASLEAFDEERQRAYRSLESGVMFPLATQRVPTSSFAPWESGWLRMDLLDQSAVTAIMRGRGRFSVGISSTQLDDPCAGMD